MKTPRCGRKALLYRYLHLLLAAVVVRLISRKCALQDILVAAV